MKNLYCDINARKKIVRLHHLNSLFQACNHPSIASRIYIYILNARGELKRTLELIIKNALVFIKAILNESFFSPPIRVPPVSQERGKSPSFFVCLFFHKQLIIKERDPAIKKPTDASISSPSHPFSISLLSRSSLPRSGNSGLLAQRSRPRRISQ